jgi:Fic family protein
MSAWEKWINTELAVPLLAKIAMAHYQFETLHPFSDGNGRLGRLVITLQLMEAGAIAHPILNLSPWLEPRKDEYKNLLLALSSTGDPDPWIAFFCQGVAAQARDSRRRIEALVAFRDDLIARLRSENAKGVVLQLAETLIGYPLITPSEVANLFGVTYPPANAAVGRLERMGVLTETTGRSYGRVYACPEVLRIVGGP